MGDLVNLRRAKKQRARDAVRRKAARVGGPAAAEAERARAEAELERRRLEAHRRDEPEA